MIDGLAAFKKGAKDSPKDYQEIWSLKANLVKELKQVLAGKTYYLADCITCGTKHAFKIDLTSVLDRGGGLKPEELYKIIDTVKKQKAKIK